MEKINTVRTLVLLAYLLSFGCSGDSDNPTIPPGHGTLTISLTDSPADFQAVNITFAEISAHIDGEWITVTVDTQTINLLAFSNGNTTELGSENIPVGQYTQVRLKIIAADVIVDGATHPMEVPSGAQSGLKLLTKFTIVEGSTYELVLDFDAHRSIVTTGPPANPKSYKLKPTIRVISKAVAGSISGTVTNPQHAPMASAIADTGLVTQTPVDTTTGFFRLAFLPGGSFVVSIADTLAQSYEVSEVPVTPGNDNDIGAVALQ